ncbi:uncharacterized protein LOC111240782 isoform X2 [Vigna radiata var. radiata]|uniref:Uncharacterized protein LOC111240782 isoform X2 n=1 Tax=Vigna radiata var. radiata TaxID=3916 RepID=A0A3Q0EJY4_VIGRR|nr:uncharacterized protein LOC111240782 isoform X2 [Vigna radiata var. radiata]
MGRKRSSKCMHQKSMAAANQIKILSFTTKTLHYHQMEELPYDECHIMSVTGSWNKQTETQVGTRRNKQIEILRFNKFQSRRKVFSNR